MCHQWNTWYHQWIAQCNVSHDVINGSHDFTSGSHDVTNASHFTTILTDHWMHSTPVQPHDKLIQVKFLPGRVYW